MVKTLPVTGDLLDSPRQREAQLIAKCLSRDPQEANRSFEELVRTHQKVIYALAYRFFHNHDDASEISQRTFIRVFQKLGSFKGESQLQTWIYQIALNLCKNFKRDEKRQMDLKFKVNEDFSERAPDKGFESAAVSERRSTPPDLKALETQEERQELKQAIADLPPMQKAVLLLRVYDELSFKEIAAIAGCSLSSAKANFHYGLKQLKQRYSGKGKNS